MFRRRWTIVGWLGLWACAGATAWGDEFDRIEGEALASIVTGKDATPRDRLTLAELDGLPTVLRDARSAFIVAATDQGNYARLLISPALRKAPGGDREPSPVLVLDRYDTFEAGNLSGRLARGKDLILFDGFEFDLDAGQVVPADQGGDLQFLADGEGGPRLLARGKAKLYTLSKAPTLDSGAGTRPSVGRTVLPRDFDGRYRLHANGQWSGTLDLKVDPEGAVAGRFRSDLNGSAYPVDGRVAPDVPHKVTFRVKFPRTQQDYEGYLWTEGKGAMAGTLTMLDRAYGFFALREGGRFAPEGDEVGPVAGKDDAGRPGRHIVVVRKGEYTLDGRARTDLELTDSLKAALAADPSTWVLLQVRDDEPYASLQHAFAAIGAAGVGTIRIGPADAGE